MIFVYITLIASKKIEIGLMLYESSMPFASRLFCILVKDDLTLVLSEGNLMETCKFHKTFTQKYISNSEIFGDFQKILLHVFALILLPENRESKSYTSRNLLLTVTICICNTILLYLTLLNTIIMTST